MKRQADTAISARDNVAAQAALQEIVKPTSIQKDHCLSARGEVFTECVEQPGRERDPFWCGRRPQATVARSSIIRRGRRASQIHDFDNCHRTIIHTPRQPQKAVTSAP
jgi:hypothetical protein